MYGSGTHLVARSDPCSDPWLYVYGPNSEDETVYAHDRWKVCQDLCDFLNGGTRPAWLNDLERTSEDHAEDLDGTSISATGPMIDADPPNLHWVQDDSWTAKLARAALMDRLFLFPRRKPCAS